jgi:uncharacterized protein YkwD
MKLNLAFSFGFAIAFCDLVQPALAGPAEMISDYRLQHREGRVTMDATLNRIAQEQATAMAAKNSLDHEVLGPFNSRVAASRSGHAAENIAYGYDNFPKTLNQWIESAGHRRNLLMHGASRVGVASARSPTSGRTYWAMVIADAYKNAPIAAGKKTVRRQSCRIAILGFCL